MRTLTLFISLFLITTIAQAQNEISINATAQVAVPADEIAFQINLNAEAETSQEAYDLHKKREKVLVELLKEHDIKEENIDFEPISINKSYSDQYSRDQKEVIQTSQMVVLTLSDFDIYEQIQITLISNDFDEFSGNFMSSESEKGEEEALKKALNMARDKAELIAQESGVTITGIKNINYSYHHRPPQPMMEMSARKSSDSLLEFDQSVSVSANVSVVYTFEQ
ncbi:SIMPL domain-containing protein [Fodinibius sp. Rm-B-1B1-1]|uniref:SIMPL domain-containing protein n=1 Tax=Fodinibius alkaliphilus TaxID=3140241 RepID=UPI003159C55A